jgi:hypothetical protein
MSRGTRTLLVILALVLAAGIGYTAYMKRPKVDTAPVAADIPAASLPVTNAEVEGFVGHDFAKILTFENTLTLDQHMEEISPYTTEKGLADIRVAYERAEWMKRAERTDVRFVTQPRVTQKTDKDGRPFWTLVCQIDVDFIGGGAKQTDRMDVTLSITTKDLNGEQALGVDQMILATVPMN